MEINKLGVYIGKYENAGWSWTNIQNYSLGTGRTLLYRKCTGLETVGKPMNIYTETYADSNTVRADYPDVIAYSATTITLVVCVKRDSSIQEGDNELKKIVDLMTFTTPTVYWDTARKKMAVMSLINTAEPKEDTYKGIKYLITELQFNNLMGYCPYIIDTFINGHLPNVEAAALPIITRILS